MSTDARHAGPGAPGRLRAIDRLRGLVMVFMAVDHAGASMDAGHLVTDSVLMWSPGTELPPASFFTRFLTHFCAPTFVFLAGTSLALSRAKRTSGASARSADLFQLRRGLFLAALDPTLITAVWLLAGQRFLTLQVLYAIGLSMAALVVLRRLPGAVLAALGVAYLAGSEWLIEQVSGGLGWGPPVWAGLLLQPAYWVGVFELDGVSWDGIDVYPLLPWLSIMLLGHAFGTRLVRLRAEGRSPVPTLVGWGAAALAIFLVVRGVDGYGNLGLTRDPVDPGRAAGPFLQAVVQWLHVSKYPPSLAFACLTLGGTALTLAALVRVEERAAVRGERPSADGPLAVFGETALFFYLAHFVVILGFANLSGLAFNLGGEGGGLAAAWWGGLGACAVLYLPCRWYRDAKRRRPDGWMRYI